MATNVELDPVFRQALRFLHSSSVDAAENIRISLDEVIKQKHGANKMLINTLSKKYLAEESKATGSGVVKSVAAIRRSSHGKSSDSSNNSNNSSPVQIITTTSANLTTTTMLTTVVSDNQQDIPVIISLPDTSGDGSIAAVDDNAIDNNMLLDNQHLGDLEDLVCVVCRRIDLSAKNRLIECTKCNSLYHQECHVPQITDSDLSNGQESKWYCNTCKSRTFKSSGAQLIASPAKSSSSSSSSSSSNSLLITSAAPVSFTASTSNNTKKEHSSKEHSSSKSKSSSSSSSSSSSRHHHSSHHSGSTSKHERTSSNSEKASSNKNSITPHIHIISADKLKKKTTKSHESKRRK